MVARNDGIMRWEDSSNTSKLFLSFFCLSVRQYFISFQASPIFYVEMRVCCCAIFLQQWHDFFSMPVSSAVTVSKSLLLWQAWLLSPWSFCCWDSLTASQILHSRKFFKKMQTFRSLLARRAGGDPPLTPFTSKQQLLEEQRWSRHTSETSHYAQQAAAGLFCSLPKVQHISWSHSFTMF